MDSFCSHTCFSLINLHSPPLIRTEKSVCVCVCDSDAFDVPSTLHTFFPRRLKYSWRPLPEDMCQLFPKFQGRVLCRLQGLCCFQTTQGKQARYSLGRRWKRDLSPEEKRWWKVRNRIPASILSKSKARPLRPTCPSTPTTPGVDNTRVSMEWTDGPCEESVQNAGGKPTMEYALRSECVRVFSTYNLFRCIF